MIPQMMLVPIVLEGTYTYVGGWDGMSKWMAPKVTELGRRLTSDELTSNSFEGGDDPFGANFNPDNAQGMFAAMAGFILVFLALQAVVVIGQIVWATQYQQKVTQQRGALREGIQQCNSMSGDFATGTFGCFDDMQYCLHASFCSPCRAGDTYQAAGISMYWNVIGLFFAASICGAICTVIVNGVYSAVSGSNVQFPGSNFITYIFMGLFFYQKRRALREKLGGDNSKVNTAQDFILWALCGCCVVAQEAKEVDRAMGVRVECCCKVTGQAMHQPMVGQGIVVTGTPVPT